MEHIGEVLKKQTQISTSKANTGTWSGGKEQDKFLSSGVCPVCQGKRFVHPKLPSGKPDFSRVVACRCTKEETAKEQQSRLLKESGLDLELLRSMSFGSFDLKRLNLPLIQRENLELVYNDAFDFAKSPDGWLVLVGVAGCGKTHLAAAIANYRIENRQPVKFVVVPDLLDHLRSAFSPESKVSYDQLFEEVKNTPLLILDDFGEQSSTPWAEEKLYQVINYRYNARLATVITTTLSLDEMDNPIGSRLSDKKISKVWNIIAPDYRSDLKPSEKKTNARKR